MCGGEGVEGEACKVRREEGREEEMCVCVCVVDNGDTILECNKPHKTMAYNNN